MLFSQQDEDFAIDCSSSTACCVIKQILLSLLLKNYHERRFSMSMIKCAECGKEISDKAPSCPNCGCPTSSQNSATSNTTNIPKPKGAAKNALIIGCIIGLVVIALMAIAFVVNHKKTASVNKESTLLAQKDTSANLGNEQSSSNNTQPSSNNAPQIKIHKESPPLTLIKEIENIPASTYKTLPFTLPYAGYVTVKVAIVQGNNLDVDVIDEAGTAALSNKSSYTGYPNFYAGNTREYLRMNHMDAGTYYLLLKDNSVALFNETVTVPAHRMLSVPFSLPSQGYLTIRANNLNGNNLDIQVVNEVDYIAIRNDPHYNYPRYEAFSQTQTHNYFRTNGMGAGKYCLLLIDKSLGILSKKQSDVHVSAMLWSSQGRSSSSDVKVYVHISPNQTE